MSSPNAARVSELDPVAAAVANAPEDDREVTTAELDALREARADTRAFVSSATVTARIAERSQRDE
jgi:ribonucleotide monophosphatase NagD (HAD superfamily)